MNKVIGILLFSMLFSVVAFSSEGKIRGDVKDIINRQGIQNAEVLIEGTEIKSYTDVNGNYLLDAVPVGTYNVIVNMEGYVKAKHENVNVHSAEVTLIESKMRTEYSWKNVLMIVIGGLLIFLAIKKEYEPTLLLPIGFGSIIMNLPGNSVTEALEFFFELGILTEAFPLLIFVAVGAMIDFSPLFKNPKLLLFGAAAQFGIFFTLIFALVLGYDAKEAASIGIIGAADGPTSIVVATKFAKHLLGPISIAAYSYMALVPIIQPPVIKALTTLKERRIRMDIVDGKPVPRVIMILFPIVVTIISGILAPEAVALIGFLMFGNLVRESGVLNKLSLAAQNELASLVTLLLGITIAFTLVGNNFIRVDTLIIIGMGLIAFIFDTAGGVLFAKFLNIFTPHKKINPMIGAAGISAFPMSSRVIHNLGREADSTNYLLMHAVSANVSGQIGSVMAGGALLFLVAKYFS